MASRPRTICRDCSALAIEGGRYCANHLADNRQLRAARDRETVRRSSGLKRLYDGIAWRVRTRRFILSRDPLCQIAALCRGQAPSVDVDHIIRAELYLEQHAGDVSYFYNPENLRGACHEDHARKTSLEARGLWREELIRRRQA
jgi:5-methylcytosine-specific restriction endonuclease McrA